MATLLYPRSIKPSWPYSYLYLRSIQSTWPNSYVHNQFSPHGHTPISTTNSVHMAISLRPKSIQSTWPHSYIYDQLSPHGHILRPQSIQSTWPHSYIYDQSSPQSYIYGQSSPHGHILMSTINPVHIIHTPVSTIKVLLFHLHLGFPNATLRGYQHRYTRNILKCRAAMARHPTVRQWLATVCISRPASHQQTTQQQQQQQQ
jgi:hypothetical protein